MAVITVNVDVRAIEHEVCLCIVIEDPLVPGDRVVAETALEAISLLMRVVVCVAVVAFCLDLTELVSFVTIRALSVGMRSEQWESGQSVIETYILGPRCFVMAILATCPLLPFVCVVLPVTGDAGRFQRNVIDRFDMAVVTRN